MRPDSVHFTCNSAGCHRAGEFLAVDEHTDGIPEPLCRGHLRMLSEPVELRPGGVIRGGLWRLFDEARAHHHAVAAFLVTGLVVFGGAQGQVAWFLIGLLAVSVIADVYAMRRMIYDLWPLSVAPLLLGLIGAGYSGLPAATSAGILTACLHASLLALAACRWYVGRYDFPENTIKS